MRAFGLIMALCVTAAPLARAAGHASVAFGAVPHRFLSAREVQADARLAAAAAAADAELTPSRHTFKAGSVIPLEGGFMNLGYYYVNISISGQTFNLLLDTGSSNLALPSPTCATCGADANRYDPSSSPTAKVVPFGSAQCNTCSPDGATAPDCPYGDPFPNEVFPANCGYGISYGGGSSFLGGYLVNDVVSFGQYTVPSTVIAMTGQYPNASFSTAPVDGILGLAHELNACNPTWAPTIFGSIVARNPSLPDLFGLCLDPLNGGVIDVGFSDPNKYTGAIQWVPQVQERWYNMPLQNVVVGSTPLSVPPYAFSYVNDQIGAFIDSGTSIILLAPLAFQSFQSVMQTQYAALPGVNGASSFFSGACVTDAQMGNALNSFPTLNFEFKGEGSSTVSLPIPPSAYLMHAGGQYCLGVQGVVGIGAVLGDVFMQQFYIVHDRAGHRIGFAPVSNCV